MTDLGRTKRRVSTGGKAAGKRIITSAPRSDDDFMTRIQLALDMPAWLLADALHVNMADVLDRHGPRAKMSSSVVDPFWMQLHVYVNERIAGLLAVKDELDRKLRLDQREHVARMAKMGGQT
jgi:hypothetical protein